MNSQAFHVLVVCTGNICRSPMAEGLLKHLLRGELRTRVTVSSAGTQALHGDRAQPFAIATMHNRGLDISGHRARLLGPGLIRAADLIVVMEPQHARVIRRTVLTVGSNVRLLSRFGTDPDLKAIPDPMGAPLTVYQACADMMQPCIQGLLGWIEKNWM